MSRKVFTSQKVSIFLGGEEIRVQALVSSYGAKYVFDDEDLPESGRAQLGAEVQVTYKGIPARSRFVRETNPAGTIYSLRFLNPSGLLLRQIEKDVSGSGIPSPWMRGLARLATTDKHLPSPVLAVAVVGPTTYYMNVRNFTLGGLLLEYSGEGAEEVHIGTHLSFELVTNAGDKFSEMTGSVTHITAELLDIAGVSGRYQFGVKFTGMATVTEMRYRGLIREHCEGLKSDTPPEGAGA